MKKKLVVYLAGLLTVLSVGFGSAQFSDVPAGHWAKEAVERIAACGLITGFPDGTFRGNQNLTRYQAALIFQRLLNELANGGQCVKSDGSGPSADDLVAIRNATQELAAELAALGVRVSALEDNAASKDDVAALQASIDEIKAMQDGMGSNDNGATQDDIAALQSSIDDLQAQIDAMSDQPATTGMDEGALDDLRSQVEAASIAADTALAQSEQLAGRLDDLEGRVDGVEGNLAALQTQVDADGDSIRALNELAVLLNQDVLSLQDRTTALEKSLADVDFEGFASKEDVSAIQEFSTALRSDLVKLSDRVGTLEGRVTDVAGRVTTLERNAFTLSGSLSLTYSVYRAWGVGVTGAANTFDIDRVFAGTAFSTGDADDDGLNWDSAGDLDLGKRAEGNTTSTLTVTLKPNKFDATSTPGKYNTYPTLIDFYIQASATGTYNSALGTDTAYGNFQLYLSSVSTTLAVAAGQPLSFSFGVSPKSKFTEYVFDNDSKSRGPGFVATLPFPVLNGKTTVVYGSKGGADGDNTYYRGVRAAFGLGPINLGASLVQEGVDQVPGNGASVAPTTVGGFDVSTALGPINLKGEYFSTSAATTANTGLYVIADAALGPIKLGASYRDIGANIGDLLSKDASTGGANAFYDSTDYNSAPFAKGQNGFGVTAGLSLGPIGLDAYFQKYSVSLDPAPNDYQVFGVTASTTLGPVALSAYFKNASAGGSVRDSVPNEKPGTGTYSTVLGVKATIANLLPGLNLTAWFDSHTAVPYTQVGVYGDYTLNAGAITAKLIGRFVQSTPAQSSNSVKYGIQLNTQPLFAGIGFFADGVSATKGVGGSTTEGLARAGISATNFLFSNSTLKVAYGGYGGQNLGGIVLGDQDNAFNAADPDIYSGTGTASGELKGVWVEWSYWDLKFSYVDFDLNTGTTSHAQAFKIGYKVTF